MKKNIAIVAGGYSSEYIVSLRSAQGIHSFINKERYNLYIALITHEEWKVQLPDESWTPIDKNDFSFTEDGAVKHFDFCYITIHGTPGEDGRLQGYFDMIGMPYSSCGMMVSALTFNKYICNQYLRQFGVNVADSIHLFRGEKITDEEVIARLGLPIFVKPNDGGSSFGVTKVKTPEAIQPAIEKAFGEGTEVTCGCYKVAHKAVVFPLTEVVTPNEFFDYDAKYNGQVDEITPARLSDELTKKIQQETSRIYDLLGAKGIIRIDYIITAEGTPMLLEINTTPGMTATSFIPQQVRAAGMAIEEVMTDIIEDELNNKKTK